MNLKKHKDDILFLPLGGAGEIGMNLNLYHVDGKWLIIDFGAGFAEDFMPGIDMIIPDVEFLRKIKDDVLGVVVTHAHEDHLGAIPYLWAEFEFPIYTTPFSAAFLKIKLDDVGVRYAGKINEVDSGGKLKLGPFDLDLVQLTHSVPEMNAVRIKTKHGNILHTGDWKLDPRPMIGPASDEEKLKQFGDEGIKALICDSTNVFSPGTSGSEGDLRDSLTDLISKCPKLCVVTTFASNVARIETVAEAAKASGRKVILAGRSLWRIVEAAREGGYLSDTEFLKDEEIKLHDREKLVVLATGCQGEVRATVNKLSSETHPVIKLKPEDTVIFASKIIPGNEKRIFRQFNRFTKMGVEVLTEKDHFVHVSGHPNKDELKRMYELARPEIAVPVHGEHVHMHEHVHLAKEWGAKDAVQVENGCMVKLAPGKPEKLYLIESGYFGIDGKMFRSPDSLVLKQRRRIQNEGVVILNIVMEGRYDLATEPVVIAPALLDDVEDADLLAKISTDVANLIEELARQSKKAIGKQNIISKSRNLIKRTMRAEVGKDPLIEIIVNYL